MALMAKSRPMAMQADGSKVMPKGRISGRANQAAWPTLSKLTMPKKADRM